MAKFKSRIIFNYLLLLGAILITLGEWPSFFSLPPRSLIAAITLAIFVLLAELLANMPRSSAASFSFLPILTAFFILGAGPAALIALIGFSVCDLILLVVRLVFGPRPDQELRQTTPEIAGRQGGRILLLSLLGYGAQALPDFALPLERIAPYTLVLLIALAIVAVLFDEGLLVMTRRLAHPDQKPSIQRAALVLRAVAALFAVMAAILWTAIGLDALIFAEVLMALTLLTYTDLDRGQVTLSDQIQRLNMLGQFDRTIKPSLTADSILDYFYVQVNAISGLRHMRVILTGRGEVSAGLRVVYAIDDGHPIETDQLPADGLFQRVLDTRKAVIADPLNPSAPEWTNISSLPSAERWLGMPLLAADAMIGVVLFWSERTLNPPPPLQEAEKELIQIIASQTGTELENALLYESTRRYAEQMTQLNRISGMINVSMNPEEILEVVMETIGEVLACDRAAFYLRGGDDQGTPLLLAKQQGFSPELLTLLREPAELLTSTQRQALLVEGEKVFIPNIRRTPAQVSEKMSSFLRAAHLSAFAAFPMREAEGMIGVLITFYDHPHDFTQPEIEMLDTFTNQAALAVTNSRVYQQADRELHRRVGQIVRMFGVSQQLSATLETGAIFETIIQSAVEECDGDIGLLLVESDEKLTGSRQFEVVARAGFDGKSDPRIARFATYIGHSGVIASGEASQFTTNEEGCKGSCLLAPICVDRKVLGVIALNSANPAHFNDDDLQFVSQLASQAGLAIRNGQLYQNAQLVRDRLKSILDASKDGLIMLDLEGNIVMTNTSMEALWAALPTDESDPDPDQGLPAALQVLDYRLGYQPGELQGMIDAGRTGGLQTPLRHTLTISPADVPARYLEKIASPVTDEDGKFIGLLLILRDVTEQKTLDEARARLTELIVHDLRAPLQAVMGSLKLIEGAVDKTREPVAQGLDMSNRAVNKMLRMVNNMLDLSRMERGEIQLDKSIEAIGPLIENALFDLAPLMQEAHAEVQLSIEEDVPFLDIDPELIERVLINLIDNALKYAPTGRSITIRAGAWPPGEREKVRIDIVDQGPGIPDDFKDAIWGRFSMIPGRKARRSSAGLGLNFCRLTIETHGGQIWVEDNPGGGSIFSFTLPAVDFEEFESRIYDG